MSTKTPKRCFVTPCPREVDPDGRYCAEHAREARAWLAEQRRLDNEADGRRQREVFWESGWLDVEPWALGWDDPDEVADEIAEDEEAA